MGNTNTEKAREALESMVWQFGHRGVKNGKPVIHTGGLSALEEAFETLGWKDPHYLPEEGYTCAVVGCMEADTAGTHWSGSKLYLRLCSKHYHQSLSGIPIPSIKQWALDREAKRDPITGCLPLDTGIDSSNQIKQAGYHRMPEGEPRLLSESEIMSILKDAFTSTLLCGGFIPIGAFECITKAVKAQREVDMRFYNE